MKSLITTMLMTLLSCSTDKPIKQKTTYSLKEMKNSQEIMKIYSSHLNSFFQKIKNSNNEHFGRLQSLWKEVIWTEILNDNQILSMSTGKTGKGMIFVLSENHPSLQKPGPTLTTLKIAGYDGILIRPYDVSAEWSAVTLIHELVHLDHRIRDLKYSADKEEYLAYKAEKSALNILSENKLRLEQKKLIEDMQLNSYIQIIWNFKNNRENFERKLIQMDTKISPNNYKSVSELEMRLGFYAISLTLDLLQRSEANEKKSIKAVGQVLKEIGKY